MTIDEARRLPALIGRAEFIEITGLSGESLDVLRREGKVRWFAVGASKKRGKYFRADAFRLAGWDSL